MAIDPKYLRASDGSGSAVLARVTTARITGATTLVVDNVENWPAFFIATVGALGPNNYIVESTKREFIGRLQSGAIIIEGFEDGFTDDGTPENYVVVVKQTFGWADGVSENLSDLLLNQVRMPDEMFGDGVVSGLDITYPATGRVADISTGIAYINGKRVVVTANSRTYLATRDTYVVLSDAGVLTFLDVAVNAAAPALPANSILIGMLSTNATVFTGHMNFNRGVVKAGGFDWSSLTGLERVVGEGIRTSATSQGYTTTFVGWNGMFQVIFKGVAGKRYKMTIHEPQVTAGGTQTGVRIRLSNIAGVTGTVGTPVEKGLVRFNCNSDANGVDAVVYFTAEFNGLQRIIMETARNGAAGDLTMAAGPTTPAQYTIEIA